ncbi:hypothetical protein VMCG_08589 [Cytospora schulzeri]|uniref:Ubiquitin-like domain-containing protein n=1 Tax=Cytospora schulzeri TaxID=448051 RepID=A0A423VVS1_9PEZI|nr:hypothetical protein VMCG_08589 [Valsa malicola]
MGCCFSCPRGPNAPYPGAAHSESASASARAINDPANNNNTPQSQLTSTLSASTANRSSQQQHRSRRHRHSRQPLDQHINKPLRTHEWSSEDRTWSPSALNRERAAFFDTRVSGRQEIWQTLKAALEVLWAADNASRDPPDIQDNSETEADIDADEHNPAVALATAQSILDAADITLPTGDLADGAYDPLGNYYQLPAHIVSDPTNIASCANDVAALGESKADVTADEDTTRDEEDGEQRREEKGKAVVNTRDLVSATIRMSDTSRDLKLEVGKDETVRSVINHISREIGYRPGHHIRLIFIGKVLRENSSLMAQGWQPGNVINAFVYELPHEADQAQTALVPASVSQSEALQAETPNAQHRQAEAIKTEASQTEIATPQTEVSPPQDDTLTPPLEISQAESPQTEISTLQLGVPRFDIPQSETRPDPQAHQDVAAPRLNLQGWAPRIHYWSVRHMRRRVSYQPPEDPQAQLAQLYHYGPIYAVPDASVGRMRRNSSNATLARSQCPRNTAPPQRRYSEQLPHRPPNLHRTVSGTMTMRPNSDPEQRPRRSFSRSQSVPPHTWVVTRVRQAAIVEQAYYSEHPQLPRSTGLVEPPRLVLEGTTTESSFQQDTFQHDPRAQPDFGESWTS